MLFKAMVKTLSQLLNEESAPKKKKNKVKGMYDASSFDFFHLIKAWPEIAGEMLAENTLPMKIHNGALFIIIKHSSFTTHLKFIENELIKKIKDKFPSLGPLMRRIQFINSSNFFSKQQEFKKISNAGNFTTESEKYHRYSPKFKELENEFNKKFSEIDDTQLKEYIFSLFLQEK